MIPNWLRRTLPKGLLARALLILVLPVVTLLLIISVSFAQRHFEGVTRQMTASVVLELRYLIDRVDAQPNPEKAAAAELSLHPRRRRRFTRRTASASRGRSTRTSSRRRQASQCSAARS